MSFLRNITSTSSTTMLSRITGTFREIAMGYSLGTSIYADVFVLAWRLPNTFRAIFAEGLYPITIPSLTHKLEKDGEKEFTDFTRNILSWILLCVLLFTLIVELNLSSLLSLIVPGLQTNPEKFELTVMLTRITFLYLPIICVTMFLVSIRHIFRKFLTTIILGILFNVLFVPIFFIHHFFHTTKNELLFNLGYGLIIIGIIQFMLVVFLLYRENLIIIPRIPSFTKDIKEIALKVPFILFQTLLGYMIAMTDIYFLSHHDGAISAYHYTERFILLPIGLLSQSVSIVLLPVLSKNFFYSKKDIIFNKIYQSIMIVSFLSMIAFIFFIVLGKEFIALMYYRGSFSYESLELTTLFIYILSFFIPFVACESVFAIIFYSQKILIVPFVISFISFLCNIIGNIIFFKMFGVVGILYATVLAAIIRFVLYIILFQFKKDYFQWNMRLIKNMSIIFLASFILFIYLYYAKILFNSYANDLTFLTIIVKLSLLSITGVALYMGIIFSFGVFSIQTIKAFFKKDISKDD